MATSLEGLLVSEMGGGGTASLVSVSRILDLITVSRDPHIRSKGQDWTRGGYPMTEEGYTRWRDDVLVLLDYVASKDYERYSDFINYYKKIDSDGFNALIGMFYHEEEQQVEDAGALVEDYTVLDFVPDSAIPDYSQEPESDIRPPSKEEVLSEREPVVWPKVPPWISDPDSVMPHLEHEQPVWLEPRHPGSIGFLPRPSRTLPSGDGTWEGANWGRPQHQHHPSTYPKVHSVLGAGFDRLIGSPDADLPHTRGMWSAGGIQSNSEAAKELWEDIEELGGQIGTGLRAIGDFMGSMPKIGIWGR